MNNIWGEDSWPSGNKALDSQPRNHGFESRRTLLYLESLNCATLKLRLISILPISIFWKINHFVMIYEII